MESGPRLFGISSPRQCPLNERLRATSCQERTSLLLKNNNELWTMVKLGPRHDIARTSDNLRADCHPSSAPNELEQYSH
jgi:hypothetical protein